MLLRELTFPIAILRENSLMGGKSAGLSSACGWNVCLADYHRNGGYDGATFFDSDGRVLEVERIYFDEPKWFQLAFERLITVGNDELVRVDMELRLLETLDFEEFCTRLRGIALDHPEWWQRHSSREEIQDMFEGCKSFKEAINDIGVLDEGGREKLPGRSSLIEDRR